MRILVLVWLCGVPWGLVAGGEDQAAHWLEKMAGAAEAVNYKGVFVLIRGDDLDTIQVAHGVGPEGVREHLLSLNAEARELVRDKDRRTCVSPAHKLVVVEEGSQGHGEGIAGISSRELDRIEAHYRLVLGQAGRVAGRACQWIEIQPRDIYRYGYRLCVDRLTGLALRSETLGAGRPIEKMVFTSLEVLDRPDGGDFEATMIAPDFTWYSPADSAHEPEPDAAWGFDELPPGFRVIRSVVRSMAAVPGPVQHMVLSDGLASVSVFISRGDGPEGGGDRWAQSGAIHSATRVVDGHQITMVGEVPAVTVQMIARSIRHGRPRSGKQGAGVDSGD